MKKEDATYQQIRKIIEKICGEDIPPPDEKLINIPIPVMCKATKTMSSAGRLFAMLLGGWLSGHFIEDVYCNDKDEVRRMKFLAKRGLVKLDEKLGIVQINEEGTLTWLHNNFPTEGGDA